MADAESKRHGSRWIDGYPSSSEVAEWFVKTVRLHDGLEAEDFLDGIVIISQKQKMNVAKRTEGGGRIIVEEERMVHVPYMRVDTRIDYFWRWMALNPEWVGVIEPAPLVTISEDGQYRNDFLPPGFFRYTVEAKTPDKTARFLACSHRVTVYDRAGWNSWEDRGAPIFAPATGTKAVPELGRWGPDNDATMKAETSSIGRALGMLGILVLGSGVATAEDMEEHVRQAAPATAAESAALPEVEVDPRERIVELSKQLTPETRAEVESWARGRKIKLDALNEDQVRPVLRRLESAVADSD